MSNSLPLNNPFPQASRQSIIAARLETTATIPSGSAPKAPPISRQPPRRDSSSIPAARAALLRDLIAIRSLIYFTLQVIDLFIRIIRSAFELSRCPLPVSLTIRKFLLQECDLELSLSFPMDHCEIWPPVPYSQTS